MQLNNFVQTAKINSREIFYLEPSAKFNSRETYFFSHPRNLVPAKISSFKVAKIYDDVLRIVKLDSLNLLFKQGIAF